MIPKISKITELKENTSTASIFEELSQLSHLPENETSYLKRKLEKESDCSILCPPNFNFYYKTKEEKEIYLQLEAARKAGSKLFDLLKAEKIETIQLLNLSKPELTVSFLEGLLLSCYSFDKYKKEKEDYSLKKIMLFKSDVKTAQIEEIQNLTEAVFYSRNLVNEPLSFLTAPQFSAEIEKMGAKAGFNVEVFNKK